MLVVIGLLSALLLASQPAAVPREPYCPESCDENTVGPADIPTDAPRFSDYPAATYPTRHPAALHLLSHEARMFRTVIREQASQGPNFAGHYTLIAIGCGAGATCWAIVDSNSGKVSFPDAIGETEDVNVDVAISPRSGEKIDFRLDSRLIVVPGERNEDKRTRGVSYLLWDGRQMRMLRFAPHRPGPLQVHEPNFN